jgi:hypothetical protein
LVLLFDGLHRVLVIKALAFFVGLEQEGAATVVDPLHNQVWEPEEMFLDLASRHKVRPVQIQLVLDNLSVLLNFSGFFTIMQLFLAALKLFHFLVNSVIGVIVFDICELLGAHLDFL